MSSRTITILAYIVSLMAMTSLHLLSFLPASKIPSFGVVIRRLMRTRTGRVGLLVAWAWLGFHYFAR